MFKVISLNHCNKVKPVALLRKHRKNLFLLVIILYFFPSIDASASENTMSNLDEPGTEVSPWSIETSITFPIARIYMVKLSYKHSDRAELGFGPAFQNWKNTDTSPLGLANAYTLLLSYRYYFWRNFNAEI